MRFVGDKPQYVVLSASWGNAGKPFVYALDGRAFPEPPHVWRVTDAGFSVFKRLCGEPQAHTAFAPVDGDNGHIPQTEFEQIRLFKIYKALSFERA